MPEMEIPAFLRRTPSKPKEGDASRSRNRDYRQFGEDVVPIADANTGDSARQTNGYRSGHHRRFRTQKIWLVKGCISGAWVETRISAPNKDAAISEAHARGMRVSECVQSKQKPK